MKYNTNAFRDYSKHTPPIDITPLVNQVVQAERQLYEDLRQKLSSQGYSEEGILDFMQSVSVSHERSEDGTKLNVRLKFAWEDQS